MPYLTCNDCGKNFYTARTKVGDERCSSCGGELMMVGPQVGVAPDSAPTEDTEWAV
jgi:tRNA G26 N,N-dimethylase Trm1